MSLTDINLQGIFCLKEVLKFWGSGISQKSNIGWSQQPLTERIPENRALKAGEASEVVEAAEINEAAEVY